MFDTLPATAAVLAEALSRASAAPQPEPDLNDRAGRQGCLAARRASSVLMASTMMNEAAGLVAVGSYGA